MLLGHVSHEKSADPLEYGIQQFIAVRMKCKNIPDLQRNPQLFQTEVLLSNISVHENLPIEAAFGRSNVLLQRVILRVLKHGFIHVDLHRCFSSVGSIAPLQMKHLKNDLI